MAGGGYSGFREELQRYGIGAMQAWVDKRPLTLGQAFVVGLWLVQAGAIRWLALPRFVFTRGKSKVREWYDE